MDRHGFSGETQLIASRQRAISPNSGMHIRPAGRLESARPHHPAGSGRVWPGSLTCCWRRPWPASSSRGTAGARILQTSGGQGMALDSAGAMAHVTTPAGRVIAVHEGTGLVFGRGPDADLVIPAGRGLSRRAGIITALAGGALVANIS